MTAMIRLRYVSPRRTPIRRAVQQYASDHETPLFDRGAWAGGVR